MFGAIGFFLNLQSDLLIGILHYSEKILKKTKDPQVSLLLETLAKNGVDIPQLQVSFLGGEDKTSFINLRKCSILITYKIIQYYDKLSINRR